MNKDILKQIILDNRVEVERYKVFRREVDMSSFPCYVLVGLRRAGKSFMLYQRMQQLLSQGHTWDEMLYVNFEDDRLEEFKNEESAANGWAYVGCMIAFYVLWDTFFTMNDIGYWAMLPSLMKQRRAGAMTGPAGWL